LNGQDLTLNIQDGRQLKVNSIVSTQTSTNPEKYEVLANIQNISDRSEASSTIQIVYEVSLDSASTPDDNNSNGSSNFPAAMNFYGDLDARGGIQLSNGDNDRAVINVAGNFTANSIKGIKTLNVIGNVNISGAGIQGLENIYTNGNVNLSGSGSVNLISAKGTVTTNGSWAAGNIYADQDVKIDSSGAFNSIDTKASIFAGGNSSINSAIAGVNINITNASMQKALANAKINHSSNGRNLDYATSGDVLTCVQKNWKDFTLLKAVSFSNCPDIPAKMQTIPAGTKVASPQGALVTVTLSSKPIVNALVFEEQANYIFSVNSSNQIIVYVRNVNSVPEGEYRIGKRTQNYQTSWGYLCKTVDSNNFCTSNIVANLGRRVDNGPEIIKYENGKWILKDTQSKEPSLAPGVLLFKGSVDVSHGYYVNTIISTQSIHYGNGNVELIAPNYASASITCNSATFNTPSNLCSSSSSLIPASIANIGLLAGSCSNSSSLELCESTYAGGDITFNGSASVEGNIIAGNKIITSGSTSIKGSILAAAHGSSSNSALGGSTDIDFDGTTSDDTTIILPGGDDDEDSGEATVSDRAKIKWARYL
jgi:cytoskeletal protein CcmA (bactofilin family)